MNRGVILLVVLGRSFGLRTASESESTGKLLSACAGNRGMSECCWEDDQCVGECTRNYDPEVKGACVDDDKPDDPTTMNEGNDGKVETGGHESTSGTHQTCPTAEHDNCCSCLSDEGGGTPNGDWDSGHCCGHCTDMCGSGTSGGDESLTPAPTKAPTKYRHTKCSVGNSEDMECNAIQGCLWEPEYQDAPGHLGTCVPDDPTNTRPIIDDTTSQGTGGGVGDTCTDTALCSKGLTCCNWDNAAGAASKAGTCGEMCMLSVGETSPIDDNSGGSSYIGGPTAGGTSGSKPPTVIKELESKQCVGTDTSCPVLPTAGCCSCLSDEWGGGSGDWFDGFCCGHCAVCCDSTAKVDDYKNIQGLQGRPSTNTPTNGNGGNQCEEFISTLMYADVAEAKGPGGALYRKGGQYCMEDGMKNSRCFINQTPASMPFCRRTYTKQQCLDWCKAEDLCVGVQYAPNNGGECWLRRRAEGVFPVVLRDSTTQENNLGWEIAVLCDISKKQQPTQYFCLTKEMSLSAEELNTGTNVSDAATLTSTQLLELTAMQLTVVREYVTSEVNKMASYETEEFCRNKEASTREKVGDWTCGSVVSVSCVNRKGDPELVDLLSIGQAVKFCPGGDKVSTSRRSRRLVEMDGLVAHLVVDESTDSDPDEEPPTREDSTKDDTRGDKTAQRSCKSAKECDESQSCCRWDNAEGENADYGHCGDICLAYFREDSKDNTREDKMPTAEEPAPCQEEADCGKTDDPHCGYHCMEGKCAMWCASAGPESGTNDDQQCDYTGYAAVVATSAGCSTKEKLCQAALGEAADIETRQQILCQADKPCGNFAACVEEVARSKGCSSHLSILAGVKNLRAGCATLSSMSAQCMLKMSSEISDQEACN